MGKHKKKHSVSYWELREYIMSNAESNIFHHSFAQEIQFIYLADHASIEQQPLPHFAIENRYSGVLSFDAVKQAEYMAVSSAILAPRYAIGAGADETEAYCLGDLYLQRISQFSKIEDFQLVQQALAQSFRELIQRGQKQKGQNYQVQKVKNYIDQHLNIPFSLEKLAQHVGRSPNYLCALFKKSEGQTIMQYALNTRIEVAKSLLSLSEWSIKEISEYLCFSSPSHFGITFKKQVGTTPSEYRKVNHTL